MQPTPRVTTIVTAIAIVLALIGIGGVAFGAADKSDDDNQTASDSTTTTSDFSSETTLPDEATTTTAAAAGTGGTTATTAKSGGSTATTTAPKDTSCGGAPATAADPGQAKPPAVGKYTYASCTDSADKLETSISAGNSSGGVTRRTVSAEQAGSKQSSTIAYGPTGVFIESLTFDTPQGRATCDLNPDVKNFPSDMHVGSEWSTSSSCDIKSSNGANFGKLKLDSAGKVTGKVATSVAGTAVNAWVVEGTIVITATIPNFGSQTTRITENGYYDAVHGIEVYRHTEGQNGESKVVRDDKLVSLTPR